MLVDDLRGSSSAMGVQLHRPNHHHHLHRHHSRCHSLQTLAAFAFLLFASATVISLSQLGKHTNPSKQYFSTFLMQWLILLLFGQEARRYGSRRPKRNMEQDQEQYLSGLDRLGGLWVWGLHHPRADPSAGGARPVGRSMCPFTRVLALRWSTILKHGDASAGISSLCLERKEQENQSNRHSEEKQVVDIIFSNNLTVLVMGCPFWWFLFRLILLLLLSLPSFALLWGTRGNVGNVRI